MSSFDSVSWVSSDATPRYSPPNYLLERRQYRHRSSGSPCHGRHHYKRRSSDSQSLQSSLSSAASTLSASPSQFSSFSDSARSFSSSGSDRLTRCRDCSGAFYQSNEEDRCSTCLQKQQSLTLYRPSFQRRYDEWEIPTTQPPSSQYDPPSYPYQPSAFPQAPLILPVYPPWALSFPTPASMYRPPQMSYPPPAPMPNFGPRYEERAMYQAHTHYGPGGYPSYTDEYVCLQRRTNY